MYETNLKCRLIFIATNFKFIVIEGVKTSNVTYKMKIFFLNFNFFYIDCYCEKKIFL